MKGIEPPANGGCDGAKRNPGSDIKKNPGFRKGSIRACMGTWLSRGVIDQDMLFPRSLVSSAKCS
jgi:hypothetical protein